MVNPDLRKRMKNTSSPSQSVRYFIFEETLYATSLKKYFFLICIVYDIFVDLLKLSNTTIITMTKLTNQEEEAMLSIWKLNGGFIKEILDDLDDKTIPYTTLASTVKNLEKKGYVKSVKYANAKKYIPILKLEEYKAKFMNRFVQDYFKNSYKEMVSFFIKEEKFTPEELEEILTLIKDNN